HRSPTGARSLSSSDTRATRATLRRKRRDSRLVLPAAARHAVHREGPRERRPARLDGEARAIAIVRAERRERRAVPRPAFVRMLLRADERTQDEPARHATRRGGDGDVTCSGLQRRRERRVADDAFVERDRVPLRRDVTRAQRSCESSNRIRAPNARKRRGDRPRRARDDDRRRRQRTTEAEERLLPLARADVEPRVRRFAAIARKEDVARFVVELRVEIEPRFSFSAERL